jgi:SAM-dependent methyltransferase
MHERLEDTLRRLESEREEADRRYNDALTALDRAVMGVPDPPPPPPGYDDHQIAPLNDSWDVSSPPVSGGMRGRIAALVWRLVAPGFQKQTAFNSRLVDHLNRNVSAHRETARAIETTIALVREQLAANVAFQARLIQYLQQVTAYVDTKDRATGGQALVVNAAVNGVADELAKRWESMVAREQRFNAKVETLSASHDELRTLVGVSQQASLVVKRELERMAAAGGHVRPAAERGAAPPAAPQPVRRSPDAGGTIGPAGATAFSPTLDAYKYVGFEDQFRGSQEVIRERLESYLPCFDGAADVLDVGCGRGEFLDLLKARGISARGLDLNHEMVEVCRARGLDVTEADAVSYLEAIPDGSLGGLFAAQVVEHLQPAYLLRLLELAHFKLRPGAPIVLETLNPACWVAFFDSFIRDITHVWPLHPETLRYLVLASGFSRAEIEFRSPVPPQDKLQPLATSSDSPVADLVETFNSNVEKLNARMFTNLDYAVVGRKGSAGAL